MATKMATKMAKAEFMGLRCGGCGSDKGSPEPGAPGEIFKCAGCGGLVGRCYKGESYRLVSSQFVTAARAAEMAELGEVGRYYDIETLGNDGVVRRHGWFDPFTKDITQVG